MTTDLTTERWLRLATEARWLARRPELDPDDLRITTGRLFNVRTPEGVDKRNACNALRATAQYFAWADPIKRVRLSRALELLADEAALTLHPPDDGPQAAAAALPALPRSEEDAVETAPAWTRRADIA